MPPLSFTFFLSILYTLVHVGFLVRAILRPHREPASRIAWVLVIMALPVVGIIAYLLLGETDIGRSRRRGEQRALSHLPALTECPGLAEKPEDIRKGIRAFDIGHSINGHTPVSGNSVELMADSNAAIARLVEDIDAAARHVHISFYIWLTDTNGAKVIEAVKRAAARGVACRVVADSLGSRLLIRSPHWADMAKAGAHTMVALSIGNPFVRMFNGRIDLRNHRKIVVIDNRITYVGSQNCADPEFRVKPKFAPWVDIMLRVEGPMARQNQHIFASQWMAVKPQHDLAPLLLEPLPEKEPGSVLAQATGTGPTTRPSAMPEIFASVIQYARRELIITTPYLIPDEFLLTSLSSAARSGVAVTLMVPARNDSRLVAAASRSYYLPLLEAGVSLHEFHGGLLHAKTMVADGEMALIGSANLDRRSFDLNYENNVLFADKAVAAAVRQRQQDYLARCTPVSKDTVKNWSYPRQLLNNTIAMFGPVL
ncbi:cardiolipin synthase [Aestuariivirga sp.]|uniref:cardiolipin synthase n=1 Tax=Aestuariivirga sp. TaxID=2650926 RepID=UPI0039E22A5C